MKIAAVAILSFVVLCVPVRLSAQVPDARSSPRAVADAFFRATGAGRWEDAVALLYLPPFERFFRQRVSSARSTLPAPTVSPEELMARDSTLPRAVAEWQAARFSRSSSTVPFGDFSREFAGITSFKALQALSPAEAAARWLEAQDPATNIRKAMAELKCSPPAVDTLQAFSQFRQHTIGAVVVDDTTAYVLFTDGIASSPEEVMYRPTPSTLQLRWQREKWRLVPNVLQTRGWGFGDVRCLSGGR